MKKNYLLLLLLLLIPISVSAQSEMRITCDSSQADPNSTVTCEVKAMDSEVSGGSGRFKVTNGTVKSIEKLHCAVGDVSTDEFACVDDIVQGSITLVSFVVQTASSGQTIIELENAKVVGPVA